MSTLILEHISSEQLPPHWAERLKLEPGQTVTVRIDTDPEPAFIHPDVIAISGLVPPSIEAEEEYRIAMKRKHST